MAMYLLLAVSVVLNGLLIWYIIRLLRKFIYISENISDLYLTTKAFQVFANSLYSMDSYNGEPIIAELIFKVREVSEEMESFRSIFEYTLDEELEEELSATQEIQEE